MTNLDRNKIFPPFYNDPEELINPSKIKTTGPPRPPNGFLLCRKNVHKQAKERGICNMRAISKVTGILWRTASTDEKEQYEKLAIEVQNLHSKRYPEKHNKEGTVGKGVRKCENIPRNKDDRFAALEEKWYQIDIETLTNLVDKGWYNSNIVTQLFDDCMLKLTEFVLWQTSSKGRLGIIEGSLAQSSSSSLKKKTSLIIDNGKSPLEQPPMQSIQPQSSSLSSPKKKLKLITNDFPSPIMQSPIQTYPASTSKRKLNFITEKEVCFESPTETLRKLQQFPLRQDKSMQQNLRSRPSYNYGLIRKFSDMIAPTKRTSNDFLTKEEQDFFLALEEELLKICEFYEIKEKETLNRWETLKECYQDIQEQIKKASKQRKQEAKCKRAVKKAILEFYRGVELLRNYQVLNKTGFAKILKKYDKISSLNGTEVYMPRVISCNFSKSNVVNDLIKEAENFYIDKFEGGLRRQAMKKLRLPNKQTTYHSVSSRVGMNIGLSIPILFKSLVLAKSNSNEYDDDTLSKLLLIYSGFFLIIIFALLIGTNMFVWERSKINYKFIFEFDPRNNLDFKEYLELPSLMLLLLSLAMYATFSSDVKFIHQENFVWILTVVAYVITPLGMANFGYKKKSTRGIAYKKKIPLVKMHIKVKEELLLKEDIFKDVQKKFEQDIQEKDSDPYDNDNESFRLDRGKNLANDLKHLLKESRFNDFSIICGKDRKKVKGCKAILASRCNIFNSIILSDTGNKNEVIFSDIEPEAMEMVLEFLYTGDVEDLEKVINEYVKKRLKSPIAIDKNLAPKLLSGLIEKFMYNNKM
ncbi:15046_t:CDS:10 [Entrophospora sp. SA101]|nr:15046_t:CDS:10 [Entrophospora sp. SA101]